MARYVAEIRSKLAPAEAFAYMADFSNARFWDPSVTSSRHENDHPIALGSSFAVVSRFARRDVKLTYAIVEYEPPTRVVLEARPSYVSRDTITVTADGEGSLVRYDAVLAFGAVGRLFDPIMQRIFDRVGAKAKAGLETALNP